MPRSKVSKKNKYYISKERYYELLHFCRQYWDWQGALISLDGLSKRPSDLEIFRTQHSVADPTAKCAESILAYKRKMDMIHEAVDLAMKDFGFIRPKEYTPNDLHMCIFESVVDNMGYHVFDIDCNMRGEVMPVSRDEFYKMRRAFFWYLSKIRE